jgi:hypothetical protein
MQVAQVEAALEFAGVAPGTADEAWRRWQEARFVAQRPAQSAATEATMRQP